MRIVTIVGARPQFIKAASVTRAIQEHNQNKRDPEITEVIVHTGQHYDYNMSQVFCDELEIREPDYHLEVGSGSHGQMTGAMLEGIEKVLLEEQPDSVLVYGDTNSTLAGALAAAKMYIPIAHVEAGLRSFNRRMPEEINRILTDHVSALLFCPTETAVGNLKKEGITEGVYNVGDVMYDSFLFNKELAKKNSVILSDLKLKSKGYCLATVHRAENTENSSKLANLLSAFEELATVDCPFVIPLHPRTQKLLQKYRPEKLLSSHVRVVAPVSYTDMIALEVHAQVILTDSGGVQKEAYFAEVPCVTLRHETEWVETLHGGSNQLGGTEVATITEAFEKARESTPAIHLGLYGEGKASEEVVRYITEDS